MDRNFQTRGSKEMNLHPNSKFTEEQNGTPLTSERSNLVTKWMAFAYDEAYKFARLMRQGRPQLNIHEVATELAGAAMFGMVVAAQRFQFERGLSFGTYCASYILKHMQDEFKNWHQIGPSFVNKCKTHVDPIVQRLDVMDDVNELDGCSGSRAWHDYIEPAVMDAAPDEKIDVDSILDRLPIPLGEVARMRYLEERTYTDIAAEFGVHKTVARWWARQAVKKLRMMDVIWEMKGE
jgi:RNA polymerase sigma factor (sigma-70 family)